MPASECQFDSPRDKSRTRGLPCQTTRLETQSRRSGQAGKKKKKDSRGVVRRGGHMSFGETRGCFFRATPRGAWGLKTTRLALFLLLTVPWRGSSSTKTKAFFAFLFPHPTIIPQRAFDAPSGSTCHEALPARHGKKENLRRSCQEGGLFSTCLLVYFLFIKPTV